METIPDPSPQLDFLRGVFKSQSLGKYW